ncbi:MAG: YfhO family protein, partial [Thermoanaerobaculia bacterium]
NLHDPPATWWQWEPGGEYLRKAVADREPPFWDPFIAAGAPAMANLTSTFFFPPYFLLILLGNGVVLKNVYFLSLLAFAGFFTYVLLRRSSLEVIPSLFGASAFMLSGALNKNVGSFLGQTLCCLPFLMFTARAFVDRPNWRASGLLAIGFGCVALSSFPPLLMAIFGVTALFIALAVFQSTRPRIRRSTLLRASVGAGLALGLVAIYYLPAFSALARTTQVKSLYATAGAETLSPGSFFELLGPGVVGGSDRLTDPPVRNPTRNRAIPYLSVTALLLASFAAPGGDDRRRRALTWTAIAATVLVATKLIGWYPVHWIAFLPVFKTIHFAVYFGNLLDFTIALLAAVGLSRLLSGQVSRLQIGTGSVVLVGFVLSLRPYAESLQDPGHIRAWSWVPVWWLFIATAAVSILLSWSTVRLPGRQTRVLVGAALVVMASAEGVRSNALPRQRRWEVWRNPPQYVARLVDAAAGGREMAIGVFTSNASSAFGVFGLDSMMAFNPSRIYALYHRYASATRSLFLRGATALPPEGVLDRAGVQAVLIANGLPDVVRDAHARGFELKWTDDFVSVFRRPGAPRFFFSSEYSVAPDGNTALELVGQLQNPRLVVVEGALPNPSLPNQLDDPAVQLIHFRRNSVKVSVTAPRPGLVYFSESHDPGWLATVNGAPEPVLLANYAFRAVAVPAGPSEIEMTYVPPGFRLGALLSGVSALAVAALVFAGGTRPDDPRRPERPIEA